MWSEPGKSPVRWKFRAAVLGAAALAAAASVGRLAVPAARAQDGWTPAAGEPTTWSDGAPAGSAEARAAWEAASRQLRGARMEAALLGFLAGCLCTLLLGGAAAYNAARRWCIAMLRTQGLADKACPRVIVVPGPGAAAWRSDPASPLGRPHYGEVRERSEGGGSGQAAAGREAGREQLVRAVVEENVALRERLYNP